MLHGKNNRFFFLWEKMFFFVQNIFIVPAMQHGWAAVQKFYTPQCGNKPHKRCSYSPEPRTTKVYFYAEFQTDT